MSKVKEYTDLINQNEEKIKEYRLYIKSLEAQNNNLNELISELNINKQMSQGKIRDVIATFCGKKVF